MKKTIAFILLIPFSIAFGYAQEESTSTVTVTISNFSSDKGKAFVSLYNSKSTFLNKGIQATQVKIDNKNCTVTFKEIPNGIYAISMFHDENDNNKMDTNFFGIPEEDYGCSNNARGFMGPPKWEDAKFTIDNESITQHIKL